ncbi:MAG: helix-turn-helix domain-containing protein [Oscillospiraceae bacterium]
MLDIHHIKLGDTLRELRKKRGVSQAQAAEYLTAHGCAATQKAVSKWEREDTQLSARQLLLLCELYDVRDVLSVFCGYKRADGRLNAVGRRRVEEYIRLLEGDSEFSEQPSPRAAHITRTIPLYDLPVSAGTGQLLDSDSYELIEIDETVPLSATFAVRISGDSMTPRYIDKQVIYVRPQQTLEPGEIGIFLLNGDAYCKQLSRDGGAALISLNKKYPPIEISEYDEMRIIGKVVG